MQHSENKPKLSHVLSELRNLHLQGFISFPAILTLQELNEQVSELNSKNAELEYLLFKNGNSQPSFVSKKYPKVIPLIN